MTPSPVTRDNIALAGVCAALISCAMVPLGLMLSGTDQALGWGLGLLIFLGLPIGAGCLVGLAALNPILRRIGPKNLFGRFLVGTIAGGLAAPAGIAAILLAFSAQTVLVPLLTGKPTDLGSLPMLLTISLLGGPGGLVGGFVLAWPRRD